MHHIHQNPKKNQIEQKTQESLKNESVASETGGQLEKKKKEQILSGASLIEDTMRILSICGERQKNGLDIKLIQKEM